MRTYAAPAMDQGNELIAPTICVGVCAVVGVSVGG